MIRTLIIFLLFFPLNVLAVTWTTDVTQDGAGGACEDGGECSVAELNALSGDYAGSTFTFTGNTTTRVSIEDIYGTSGNPIVFDGYAGGDCDPVSDNCASGVLLGQGFEIGNNTTGPDYITVQDFRMTTTSGSDGALLVQAVLSANDATGWSEGIIFRRNYIYETNSSGIVFQKTKYGIIEKNKVVHFAQGVDAANQINISGVEDIIVRQNEFGHDEISYPSVATSANIVEVHACQRGLIEYNRVYGNPTQGGGIILKEGGAGIWSGDQDDIIIRFNHVHDNGTATNGNGIYVVTGVGEDIDDVYIYGNFVYGHFSGNIFLTASIENIFVWSNVIFHGGRNGITIFPKSGEYPDFVYIYNNTIARNNTSGETNNDRGGITLTSGGTTINIKNNILYDNRPAGAGSKYNQIFSSIVLNSLEHNTLYNNVSTATWYYDGAVRTLATMQSTYNFEDDVPAGVVEDPLHTDPDGNDNSHGTEDDDYTLQSTSPAIDDGADLGGPTDWSVTIQGVLYEFGPSLALDHSSTDWTSTIPTIGTRDRDIEGWDRGAYVYIEETGQLHGVSVSGGGRQ